MMTDTTFDTTTHGDLVALTDDEIDSVNGGILPIIAAAGAFVAANAAFFTCVAAGAAIVGGFWFCATHYK